MKSLLLTTAATFLAFQAHAADLNETRVNELIGEYLRDNPQAIIDSLQAHQMQEQEARAEKQAEAVKGAVKNFEGKNLHYGEAGNPKGDLLIVEFFDYNCPACKMMFESLDQLLVSDKKVRVVFVEMPIFGAQSDENAKVSMAVHALAPQKYYRFHEAAMRHKGKISADQLIEIASNLEIDAEALKKEAAKDKYIELIAKDREIAGEIGVTGTPALIVGDQFIGGALSAEQLKAEVKKAREKKAEDKSE
jgi:protein-disulfide isomerase